uniref:EGF-like domain-containing protein n=1 Tax=Strongyloides venezuelensis TaxID=75913 RepID=A0A0K0F4M2_STRVS
MKLLFYGILILCFTLAKGNIRLLSPVSISEDFDFSKGSPVNAKCHDLTEKDTNTETIILGETFNVSWIDLAKLNGLYTVEVLDFDTYDLKTSIPLKSITPQSNSDSYIFTSPITLNKDLEECDKCYLRLVQTTEEKKDTEPLNFISCSLIKILKKPETNQAFKTTDKDCIENSDCLNGGKCDGDNKCFCLNGFYGKKCEESNNVDNFKESFEPKEYEEKDFVEGGNKLYWKFNDNNEIEFVLQFPVNSWVLTGIRPFDYKKTCPTINYKDTAFKLDSQTTKKPLQKIDVKLNTTNLCKENEVMFDCPEISRECEASCDWTADPDSIPKCSKECGKEPRCVCKDGFVRAGNFNDTCVPFSQCQEEVEQECGKNTTFSKCGVACEPTCENMYDVKECLSDCQSPGCTCSDNYVRHNGECIFWGDCSNLMVHLSNTTGKSIKPNFPERVKPKNNVLSTTTTLSPPNVPVPSSKDEANGDLHCPVNETINDCGRICEADCLTIFVREQCTDCGEKSCACKQGYARLNGKCVYWGDCPLTTEQVEATKGLDLSTVSSVPTQEDSVPARAQAIKTVTNVNNGEKSSVNMLRELKKPSFADAEVMEDEAEVFGDDCFGEFRYPAGCLSGDCDYRLSWNLDDLTDNIEFSIEAKMSTNYWTGVGFSKTGHLADSDFIGITSINNNLKVVDLHTDTTLHPKIDKDQNINKFHGEHINGILKAEFVRPRASLFGNKHEDAQFTDNSCYKFIFPVAGKELENGKITNFPTAPIVSENEICVKKCKECVREFKYPQGCEGEECKYVANWNVDKISGEVEFEISSKGIGRWTGIGFSKDGSMANADMILGWVYDGEGFVTDRFSFNKDVPVIDASGNQDVYIVKGDMEDNTQTITFRRKIITPDTKTDFPLNECYYFLYPVSGGRILATSVNDYKNPKTPILAHDTTPIVSSEKICICGAEIPTPKRFRRQVSDPFKSSISATGELPPMPKENIQFFEDPLRCSDVVLISSNSDGLTRVKDYYALSSSFVRPDEFYGGEQSLDKVVSYVKDNIVTVSFSRKLDTGDFTDQPVNLNNNQPMTILFAQGILPNPEKIETIDLDTLVSNGGAPGTDTKLYVFGKNFTSTQKPKETKKPELTQFKDEGEKVDDVFSKTGIVSVANASGRVLPKAVDDCDDYFKYPSSCGEDDCKYLAKWIVDNGTITVQIRAKQSINRWTGIGFSPEGSMSGTDLIAVSVLDDGTSTITDQFVPDYNKPTLDSDQGIFDLVTKYENGYVYAKFSRELQTNDNSNDVNLESEHCNFFVYPVSGGGIVDKAEIQIHDEIPIVSEKKICLKACGIRSVKKEPVTAIPITPEVEITTIRSVDEVTVPSEEESKATLSEVSGEIEKVETTQGIVETSTAKTEGEHEPTTVAGITEDEISFENIDMNLPEKTPNVTAQSTTVKAPVEEPEMEHTIEKIESTTEVKVTEEKVTDEASATTVESKGTEENVPSKTTESVPEPEITTTEKAIPTTTETTKEIAGDDNAITSAEGIFTTEKTTVQPKEGIESVTKPGSEVDDEDDQINKNIINSIQNAGIINSSDEPTDGITLILRILNRKWDDSLLDKNSEAYKNLTKEVKETVQIIIKDKYPTLAYDRVLKYNKGSVLAYVHLEEQSLTDKEKSDLSDDQKTVPSIHELSDHIRQVATLGTIGKLNVDPDTVRAYNSEGNSIDQVLLRNWIIVGLIIFGLLLLCCLASCLFFCCSKKSKKREKKDIIPHYGYGEYDNKGYKTSLNNVSASYTVNPIYSTTPGSVNGTMKVHKTNGVSSPSSQIGTQQMTIYTGGESQPNGDMTNVPEGLGETTYTEWQRDVASKDTPSHVQESTIYQPAISSTLTRQTSPYITYPSEPTYYSMTNDPRYGHPHQNSPMTPSGYYRPY